MVDFVISTADAAAFDALAKALGFYGPNGVVAQGPIPGDTNPMASYALNVVGQVMAPTGATTTDDQGNISPVMAALPGYWARLRINGLNPFASGAMIIPPQVKVYFVVESFGSPAFWSLDGVTPAPDYIAVIGNLA